MPKPLSSEKKLEWEEKIRKQKDSGFSIERWCNEHQIRPHTFHYWKERLSPKLLPSRLSFDELSSAFVRDKKNYRMNTISAAIA